MTQMKHTHHHLWDTNNIFQGIRWRVIFFLHCYMYLKYPPITCFPCAQSKQRRHSVRLWSVGRQKWKLECELHIPIFINQWFWQACYLHITDMFQGLNLTVKRSVSATVCQYNEQWKKHTRPERFHCFILPAALQHILKSCKLPQAG